MQITFQEAQYEEVVKSPKNRYTIANVVYTYNGSNRTYKLFSFANPEVFAAVKKLTPGETIDVTIVKNDKGYDSWAKISSVKSDGAAPTMVKTVPFKDERETRDERIERQLHIVRQSSLSNAVNTLVAGAKAPPKVEDVLALAQQYVDFVYDTTIEDLVTGDGDFTDVPI